MELSLVFDTIVFLMKPGEIVTLSAIFSFLTSQDKAHFWTELCDRLDIAPRSIQKSQASIKSLEELPSLYETSVCSEVKNKKGVTYTPSKVAEKIVSSVLDKFKVGTIIDPACGAGIFLLHALQKIAPRALPFEERSHILTKSIYGIDIDPSAVFISKSLLLSELLLTDTVSECNLPDLSNNIYVDDALLGESLNSKRFDFIIGNPPYGISRDQKLSKDENKKLRLLYKDALSGRVNKYLLFIWKSLNLLKNGGTLSFVIPNAWLGIKEAFPLRERLFHECSCSIEILSSNTFTDRSVEPVILTAIKRALNPHVHIITDNIISIPREVWKKAPGLCIPTKWDSYREKICTKLLNQSITLGSSRSKFIPRIALQAYAEGRGTPPQTKKMQEEKAFHGATKHNDQWIRYLEGKDVGRYRLNWSGQFIHYGPWLSEMQPLSRFQGPRLVLREITGKSPHLLKAVFTKEDFIYNKSILHILPKESTTESEILTLLAYLNSEVVSTWLSVFGRKCQRTIFPKIVLDDLKDIPIPDALFDHYSNLGSLALQQITGYTPERDGEINQIIYSFFEIGSEKFSLASNCS